MNNGVLLVGGGGHCLAVIDVLKVSDVHIAGIIHGPEDPLEPLESFPSLGRDTDLEKLRQYYACALITVGQIKTATRRKKLFYLLTDYSYDLLTVISPFARIADTSFCGKGTIIMHNVSVGSKVHIGENCIINTGSIIEHESIIDDHCHIALGAILCGHVSVGEGSFIGAGTICREGVSIGKNVVIGCGLRILYDIPDNEIIKNDVTLGKRGKS